MLVRERALAQKTDQLRHSLDRALVRARSVCTPYKLLAYEVIQATGADESAEELLRVANALRTRAAVATKRHARAASTNTVANGRRHGQHGRMTNTPFRRRREVVEEWYGDQPSDQCPPPFGESEMPEVDEGVLSGPPSDHDLSGCEPDRE
jgi:hypothetical protein